MILCVAHVLASVIDEDSSIMFGIIVVPLVFRCSAALVRHISESKTNCLGIAW